jgi:hypothetical protein
MPLSAKEQKRREVAVDREWATLDPQRRLRRNTIFQSMTLDLTDDEARALAKHLRKPSMKHASRSPGGLTRSK